MTLTNTGDCAGAETVQLYVGQCHPSVVRPVKELKAFRKVFLQPGKSREIRFGLPAADFAFYDEKSGGWKVESDKYVLYCGTSSDDIASSVIIQVK